MCDWENIFAGLYKGVSLEEEISKGIISVKEYLLIIVVMNFVHCLGFSQTGNWLWARQGVGNNDQYGRSCATDPFGNIYAAGDYFDSTITFGSTTLPNAGGIHVFLVKYSPNGNVLWAKCGKEGDSFGYSVTSDASGNAYVTGNFSSNTLIFDNDTLTNPNGNGGGMFIVKYSPTGVILWAKIAGRSADTGFSIVTDTAGNVFVTGYFHSPSIIFGTDTLYTLTNSFSPFIVKYSSSGTVLWAKGIAGYGLNQGVSLATDLYGNVFVLGYFNTALFIGMDTLTNTFSVAIYNLFMVKYSSTGAALWVKNIGATSSEYEGSVATDILGNAYVTGNFQGRTIVLGSDTLFNADTSGVTSDMFIVKYSTNGAVILAKRAGGINGDYGCTIATNTNASTSDIYVTGSFNSSTIIFDLDTLVSPSFMNWPSFIVKYDENLNIKCASSLANHTSCFIAKDNSDNAYIVGGFPTNPFVVGSDTLLATSMHANGPTFFIAKYNCNGEPVGITKQSDIETISICPNPFTSQTTIIFSEEQKHTIVSITDVLGKEVYHTLMSGGAKSLTIEKGTMQPGIYFVKATDQHNKVSNLKVMVQ